MASKILEEFERQIDGFTLIPSGGGVFEVQVGDTLVYSKKETGEHTEYEAIADDVRAAFS